MRTIGGGVATNLAGFVAMSGVASLLKFVPVVGPIGSGVLLTADCMQ